jgi:hypothetical protein
MQKCTTRTAEEEHESQRLREERQERTIEYMDSLLAYKLGDMPRLLREARERHHSWLTFAKARPPLKIKTEDGHVLKYDTDLVYWSGLDDSGRPYNTKTGGLPLVQLMQGPIDHRIGRANPKHLPEGMTLGDHLQHQFDEANLNYQVRTIFEHGWVKVMVIWDIEGWEHRSTRSDRVRDEPDEAEVDDGKMTLAQYKAKSKAKRTPSE